MVSKRVLALLVVIAVCAASASYLAFLHFRESSATGVLPFRIESNADFAAYANGGGNGSAENPWILENYTINGTGYDHCISISNTTDHFVLRNSLLHSTGEGERMVHHSDAGLKLSNIRNGTITNNTFYNSTTGIRAEASINIIIHGNGFTETRFGISFRSSKNSTLRNNSFSRNEYALGITDSDYNLVRGNNINTSRIVAIGAYSSNNNTIAGNSILNNVIGLYVSDSNGNALMKNNIAHNNLGMWLKYSVENIISNNSIINNSQGIDSLASRKTTIENNYIALSASNGMLIQGGSYNTIRNNSLLDNRFVHLWNSRDNLFYHNNFINTSVVDDGHNRWDNGFEGNYWNDYTGSDRGDGIGDVPYEIPGNPPQQFPPIHNEDRYPLMNPMANTTNVSLPGA